MSKDSTCEAAQRALQTELVKVQRHVIEHDQEVVILFEGRRWLSALMQVKRAPRRRD